MSRDDVLPPGDHCEPERGIRAPLAWFLNAAGEIRSRAEDERSTREGQWATSTEPEVRFVPARRANPDPGRRARIPASWIRSRWLERIWERPVSLACSNTLARYKACVPWSECPRLWWSSSRCERSRRTPPLLAMGKTPSLRESRLRSRRASTGVVRRVCAWEKALSSTESNEIPFNRQAPSGTSRGRFTPLPLRYLRGICSRSRGRGLFPCPKLCELP